MIGSSNNLITAGAGDSSGSGSGGAGVTPGSTQFVSTAAASVGTLAGQSTSTIISTVEQNYLQSLSRYSTVQHSVVWRNVA